MKDFIVEYSTLQLVKMKPMTVKALNKEDAGDIVAESSSGPLSDVVEVWIDIVKEVKPQKQQSFELASAS